LAIDSADRHARTHTPNRRPGDAHIADERAFYVDVPRLGVGRYRAGRCADAGQVSAAAALCRETNSAIGSATAAGSVVTEK
jgi:hypothetical protein